MAKLFNKNVKTWLKLDASHTTVQHITTLLLSGNSLKSAMRKKIYKMLFSKIDLLSVETQCVYNQFMTITETLRLPIALIPNGISKTLFCEAKKEKIILSVARFGSHQKNTEILLEALAALSLHDWKIYLVGPIENSECDFQKNIDAYYNSYPQLRDSIFFTGNISDESELQRYYDRASVFILPSRFEGFSLSTLEAASRVDFLVLTDVGAARDLVISSDHGIILPNSEQGMQNDLELCAGIKQILQNIIDGTIQTDRNLAGRLNFYRETFSMEKIVKNKPIRDWIRVH